MRFTTGDNGRPLWSDYALPPSRVSWEGQEVPPGAEHEALETFGYRDEARKVISSPHVLARCRVAVCGCELYGNMQDF